MNQAHALVRGLTLKIHFEIIPDINIIWHQFVEYSLKDRVQVNGRDTGSNRSGHGPGSGFISILYFFLQIYKLRGSYIKECKNHLRKSKIFTIFKILSFWEFRV